MTTSNVKRMRELLKRATESAEAVKYESDNNMCALYQTNIVRFNKAIDKAAPALLEIAEAAQELMNPYPSNGFGGQYAMADNILDAKKKLEAALTKFNSLKIEGL